jgi:ClpP class serine protease
VSFPENILQNMILSSAIHARAPWAIMPDMLTESLAALSAARPPKRPMYKSNDDGEYDMSEDWSLADRHNSARLMIQQVGGTTAVLQIRGMIVKDCPFYYWMCGYATPLILLDAALDMVAEGGFTSLILDFNSPGGSVLGLQETASRIKALQTQGVHTTAYASIMCASAAYYIASACQEIFASPSAIVGSIGTYSVFMDWSKAAEMSGLSYRVFVARDAPLKAAGADGTLTQAQADDMQRHVDEADSLFQAQLKGSRKKLNLEQASTGAWWNASSAPRGMVDDASLFHSLDDLLAVLAA